MSQSLGFYLLFLLVIPLLIALGMSAFWLTVKALGFALVHADSGEEYEEKLYKDIIRPTVRNFPVGLVTGAVWALAFGTLWELLVPFAFVVALMARFLWLPMLADRLFLRR